MPELDLERLRLTDQQRSMPKPTSRPPRPKTGERFLKGPIPWSWLCAAFSLPGRAGAIGVALWFRSGLARNGTVRFSHRDVAKLGVSRYAARRGLQKLEGAGLVGVQRRPGHAPTVTILTGMPPEGAQ